MTKATNKTKASPAKAKSNESKKPRSDTGKKSKKSSSGDSGGKTAEQQVAEVLAKFVARGNREPEREKIESITKLKKKTVANIMTSFRKKGCVELKGKTVNVTDKGVEYFGPMAETGGATNAEVQAKIKEGLKGKALTLFEVLEGGKNDREEVAKELGYDNGKVKGFLNLLSASKYSEKKADGFIDYDSSTVQLNREVCFPWDE